MNKDLLKLEFPCTIALDIKIKGNFPVIIESGTVIHPKVLIDSSFGPVFIGKKCIIEENCTIKAPNEQGIRINDTCIIEFRSVLESYSIGSGTRVSPGCFLGAGSRVGEDCKIMAKTYIEKDISLPDGTVVYSDGKRRILDISLRVRLKMKGPTEIRTQVRIFPLFQFLSKEFRELCILAIRQGPVPTHIAFVMDGNRRWAKHMNLEPADGHSRGFENMKYILEICYKVGIKVVTIYAFSIENFKRTKHEIDIIMDIGKTQLTQFCSHGDMVDEYGIRLNVLGQKSLLKPDFLELIEKATNMTKSNTRHILIVFVVNKSKDGKLDLEKIDETTLDQHMFTHGCPPLDMLIRTSGVQRLSDFMLWQCHKTTIIKFIDCYWPDFNAWKFLPLILEYQLSSFWGKLRI
ncbi:hypothetical protein MERGE_000068 [Pneumocystis wakefieldiae]|uniref:Alkyl transferase n=1 Tax=Pneumocystis wakefieldiae TaxID=38082 RepID=A0A899FPB1_9ASCO|nr:hypothetical protein MERGE_000068 [Pneumocystis wakefieldiae]